MTDGLMTPLELAAYLRVERRTVYRYLRDAGLPGIRMVGRWRFRKDEIDRWLLQGTGRNGDKAPGPAGRETASPTLTRHHVLAAVIVAAITLWANLPATASDTPPIDRRPGDAIYVFISSSMPEPALLTIAKDAASLRTPLLLRGLVGQSLQDTLAKLHPLIKTGAAIEIDPLVFEAYGIDAAPAVVLTCGERGEGPYAVIYGLSPSQALPILRKTLPCAPLSR
jgi:type-F conjugative transfer system pilin assembly protein TrbC